MVPAVVEGVDVWGVGDVLLCSTVSVVGVSARPDEGVVIIVVAVVVGDGCSVVDSVASVVGGWVGVAVVGVAVDDSSS